MKTPMTKDSTRTAEIVATSEGRFIVSSIRQTQNASYVVEYHRKSALAGVEFKTSFEVWFQEVTGAELVELRDAIERVLDRGSRV